MSKVIAKVGENLVLTSQTNKQSKKILDEETYTEKVEKIIVRDFFPDHEHLEDQKEYLDAEERKDFERMRQLALKYAAGGSASSNPTPLIGNSPLPSPATFETPNPHFSHQSSKSTLFAPKSSSTSEKIGVEKKHEGDSPEKIGLDGFLSKYTSEDNQSFEAIMEKTEQARREKHGWLYEAERDHEETTNKILQLENASTLAITDGSSEGNNFSTTNEHEDKRIVKPIHTWKYKNKNPLMYYPEGINKPSDDVFKKPRLIEHKNTRFNSDMTLNETHQNKMTQAATEARSRSGEKIGLDGKSIIPHESPRVGGYGFVATPSPMPGVNQSPLMTWGEIESTPARIDVRTPGPSFRFPEQSERDKLTYKMVDQNTKRKRAKKDAALKQMKASVLGTPKFGSIISSERINTLSPAARRLVNKKFNLGSDKALKASYTPSPSHRREREDGTPIVKTPSLTKTPKESPGRSITDNLLNIPNKTRKSAADFF